MKKLMIPFVLALSCTLLGSPPRPAAAADLDPAKVPADAKWLVHFDWEQILNTKLVDQLRESRPQMVYGIRGWLEGELGINPQEDLRSATMFSRSYHSYTGTVILQVDYDREKVEARLRKNPTLKTTDWNDQTLYTVTLARHDHRAHDHKDKDKDKDKDKSKDKDKDKGKDKGKDKAKQKEHQDGHDRSGGKQMTVVMKDDSTLVLASSVDNAKSTLRLLNGDGESLKGSDSPLLSGTTDDAMFYGAAIDLKQVKESNAFMPVLQQHDRITLVVGERDGQLFKDATFVGSSDEVAERMEQVLQGVLAYERLWAGESDALTKLFDAGEISRDGQQVRVQWQGETDTVLAGLKDLKKRLDQRKQKR